MITVSFTYVCMYSLHLCIHSLMYAYSWTGARVSAWRRRKLWLRQDTLCTLMDCHGLSVPLSESHFLTLWTLAWVSVAVKPLGKQWVIGWSPDQMGLVLCLLPFLSHYQFSYSCAPCSSFSSSFFYVCTHACEFMFFCVNPCGGLRLTTRRFLQSFSIFNFLVLLFLRQDLSDLGLKLTLTGEHLGHTGFDLDPSPWFQVW